MEPIIGMAPGAPEATPAGDIIKDSSLETFSQDVLEASMERPVIVDFWAPWCGPCKQLTPVIEKVVLEAKGAVRLVKVNIDENQEIAAQLRIQSIPTVYAFFQGRPIDGFQGALPESQLKSFVQRLIEQSGAKQPGADLVEEAMAQADGLKESGDLKSAAAIYMQILQQDPANDAAMGKFLRCKLELGEIDEAKEIYDALEPEMKEKPEIASFAAALELAESGSEEGEIPELTQKLENAPNDYETRFALAQALYAANRREEAVDQLLEIVARQRGWNEEAARKELVKYFEAWGPTDPLTVETRRRLSSILFS